MTTKIQYRWLLPTGKERDELRSFCPEGGESNIRRRIWRLLWTGVNNPPLTGRDETVGLSVLRWLRANASLNEGLGPGISCSTLNHLYIAVCAAWGIWARKVVAVDLAGEPDHSSEFWSYSFCQWIHVVPQLNGIFRNPHSKWPLSYREWSLASRAGDKDLWKFYSPTGGTVALERMDVYAKSWAKGEFTRAGVLLNGNAVHIDGQSSVQLLQVWRDPENRLPEWNAGLDATPQELDPDMSNVQVK